MSTVVEEIELRAAALQQLLSDGNREEALTHARALRDYIQSQSSEDVIVMGKLRAVERVLSTLE